MKNSKKNNLVWHACSRKTIRLVCWCLGTYNLILSPPIVGQSLVKINCYYEDIRPGIDLADPDSLLLTIKEPFKVDRYIREFDNKYSFSFNTEVDEPSPALLCIGNNCLDIILDSPQIFIKINGGNFKSSVVTGSPMSRKWSEIADSLRTFKSNLLDKYSEQFEANKNLKMTEISKMHQDIDSVYIQLVQEIIDDNVNAIGWSILIRHVENLDSKFVDKMLLKYDNFSTLRSYKDIKSHVASR